MYEDGRNTYCSFHKKYGGRMWYPEFKCRVNSCESRSISFADYYFSTCCNDAMKKVQKCSEEIVLGHLNEKIKNQEQRNRDILTRLEMNQAELNEGEHSLRNLTAARDRYLNFKNPPSLNEEHSGNSSCKICFNEFNTDDRFESAITPCGHKPRFKFQ
ncbi:Oidioi.mRNA.OKI2018_I69.chr1.g3703.t1.cds [Oikopleura dioica]|uniref:Oidioi.mRNA.OKI2018_I69.chr1.g3703.t1.cds n=1 Tax=Oikopleura dioica TaxID=34765 RepID=A0ABN7T1U2_OIKDI|nr:Oidioi.mRNA.OKI2018_I69.chr1.g3703.t1.cds [Oikopleura dioica]